MAEMTDTPTILRNIIERKHEEVKARKQYRNLHDLEQLFAQYEAPRGFTAAIVDRVAQRKAAVIAEIKRASPSKGIIRDPFIPEAIAESYAKHGAACLSVLTDADFFQGHEDFLIAVRNTVELPVIRKDFIVDAYQVAESRAIGADCILLIASALDQTQLNDLHAQAIDYGMDVLIEVHDAAEMQMALMLDNRLVGVNNRNLHSFEVSLQTTIELANLVDDQRILVTESGILSKEDVILMQQHNIHAFLVGEAFMRAEHPGEKLAELFFGDN